MAGKTLLDATNAVTDRGDLVYPNSSLAEHLQAALPDVHVVKSLNTAAIEVQADPSLTGPATVFFDTIRVLKTPFFNIQISR
jgi:predicted dinucleotide-binding enzyme